MPKWEYLTVSEGGRSQWITTSNNARNSVVELLSRELSDKGIKQVSVNDAGNIVYKGQVDVTTMLNTLGTGSWELTAIMRDSTLTFYYFKRPY